jgi:hypothetical protein
MKMMNCLKLIIFSFLFMFPTVFSQTSQLTPAQIQLLKQILRPMQTDDCSKDCSGGDDYIACACCICYRYSSPGSCWACYDGLKISK